MTISSLKIPTTALTLTALLLTACASGPSRGGPPNGGDGRDGQGGPQGGVEFEGTLAEPIGLLFTSMDSNGDALISQAEVAAGIDDEWTLMARRGTVGAIVYSDWATRALGSAEARPTFLAFDENFNSSLSKDEFSLRIKTEFKRLDADNDGQLSRAEMIKVIIRPQARQQQGGGQQGGGQSGGQGGGMGGGRQ